MKCLCNRWVFVRNPHTSKEMVQFVHEVHPIFVVTLSTFVHMLCGWNDDTMPSFNLFRVHLQCFSISGSFSAKKSLNACKIANIVRKGWNLRIWLISPFFKFLHIFITLGGGLCKLISTPYFLCIQYAPFQATS